MNTCLSLACLFLVQGTSGSASTSSVTAPPFEEMPKFDVHSHIFWDIPGYADMLRRSNFRVISICYGGFDIDRMKKMEQDAEAMFRKYGSLICFLSAFGVTQHASPDYVEQVTSWLDASFRAGALGVKAWKDIGLQDKKADGRFILPDDPIFDPIYDYIATQGKPLFCHFAEPKDAWDPLDPEKSNPVTYAYYSANPDEHLYNKPGIPSHERIIAARDAVLKKHPNLVVVGVHLGSMEHDVDEVAKRLDAFPNFYVDTAARMAFLALQPPDKVRAFFSKYQDRILYGIDLMSPPRDDNLSEDKIKEFLNHSEQSYRIEWQYYAGTGTVDYLDRKIECLGLTREVLEKFYHSNALRIIPGLKDIVEREKRGPKSNR